MAHEGDQVVQKFESSKVTSLKTGECFLLASHVCCCLHHATAGKFEQALLDMTRFVSLPLSGNAQSAVFDL